jgi:hypothetical protein
MGRKTTVNVKENKNYFNEYYHKTNELHTCECGCTYLLHSKRKHLVTKKHIDLMKFRETQAELEKLKSDGVCSIPKI